MATKLGQFRQDLPPAGGYADIQWKRQFTGKKINGAKVFAIAIGVKVVAYCYWRFKHLPERKHLALEMNDARIAVVPLYLAESDRTYMKHLRAVRDEERELMKNVPGWEVGTLYGEPIYHNTRERFIMPERKELVIHSQSSDHKFLYPAAKWLFSWFWKEDKVEQS